MQASTWRVHTAARLMAIAGLLIAAAGCGGTSSSEGTTLPPAYAILGLVSGDVAAGVTVRIQGGREALTDGAGRYRIGGVRDGTYTLEAALDGYTFTPATRTVTVSGANVGSQDFTAQAGLSIAGTVTGAGRAGVTVALTGTAAPPRTATTDADGNYRFLGVAPGIYRVTPTRAGGWTFSPANALVTVASASLAGPDFTSIPATHGLSGRVTGAFTAGVMVTLSGAATATAVTDGTGAWAFTGLPPGSYVVTPSRLGAAFSPASRSVTIASADVTSQDFVSNATHRISGRVAGDVLGGVQVSLSGGATGSASTDPTGYFEFAGLPDGAYLMTPSLAGYAFGPAQRAVTLAGADVTSVDFAATAVGAATFTVSGAVGGAVRAGVTVALQGATTAVTTTDVAGAFRFEGVAPGDYLLIPLHEDYVFDAASRFVVVGAADVTGQDFSASVSASARTIAGTVSGAASSGVAVTLVGPAPATTSRTLATDGLGGFAFRNLSDGLYLATPSLAGFSFTPANCLVTVAGPSVSSIQFTAAVVPHAISGRISGAQVAGVTVHLTGGANVDTVTAADGRYAFTGLVDGAYVVTPELAGHYFSPAAAAVALGGADVTGIDFVSAQTRAISGLVGGDVLAGVTITLTGAASGEATTDAAGRYSFTGLQSGGYVLTAALEGYAFEPQRLAIDLGAADVTTADFTATFIPTYSVAGTLSGPAVAGITVTLSGTASATTTTDAAGAYRFTGLPDGSYMTIPAAVGFTFDPASRGFRINRADVSGQDFTSAIAP